MTGELTIDRKFHVTRQHLGRKKIREGSATKQPTGRIPRVARVMALAMRCEQLIRDGVIKTQSELAHYGQITTARMTHIMWLINLAPDIQEAILFLPRVQSGPDPVKEIDVRRIAQVLDWGEQRRLWAELLKPPLRLLRPNVIPTLACGANYLGLYSFRELFEGET